MLRKCSILFLTFILVVILSGCHQKTDSTEMFTKTKSDIDFSWVDMNQIFYTSNIIDVNKDHYLFSYYYLNGDEGIKYMDHDGNIKWKVDGANIGISDPIMKLDNSFIFSYWLNGDNHLVNLDYKGNVIWSKTGYLIKENGVNYYEQVRTGHYTVLDKSGEDLFNFTISNEDDLADVYKFNDHYMVDEKYNNKEGLVFYDKDGKQTLSLNNDGNSYQLINSDFNGDLLVKVTKGETAYLETLDKNGTLIKQTSQFDTVSLDVLKSDSNNIYFAVLQNNNTLFEKYNNQLVKQWEIGPLTGVSNVRIENNYLLFTSRDFNSGENINKYNLDGKKVVEKTLDDSTEGFLPWYSTKDELIYISTSKGDFNQAIYAIDNKGKQIFKEDNITFLPIINFDDSGITYLYHDKDNKTQVKKIDYKGNVLWKSNQFVNPNLISLEDGKTLLFDLDQQLTLYIVDKDGTISYQKKVDAIHVDNPNSKNSTLTIYTGSSSSKVEKITLIDKGAKLNGRLYE